MSTPATFPPLPAISRPTTNPTPTPDDADVAELVRHLAATPPSFLAEPKRGMTTGVHVDAVLADVIVMVSNDEPSDDDLLAIGNLSRNHLRLVMVTCWLLSHPVFARRGDGDRICWLLGQELAPLAELIEADLFTRDPERGEELCRRVLAGLGQVVANETPEESAGRLIALDSARRARLLRDAGARSERAEQVRAALNTESARTAVARFHQP